MSYKVYIIQLGFGNWGSRVFNSAILPLVRAGVLDGNITLEYVVLADPRFDALRNAQMQMERAGLKARIERDLEDALRWIGRTRNIVMIYDSSETSEHMNNLRACIGAFSDSPDYTGEISRIEVPMWIYLGEKPMALNERELTELDESLEKIKNGFCFVDLIDVFNPATEALVEYICNNELTIEHMCFFRYNSVGLQNLCTYSRPGIEGGSALDKSIHDAAIAATILQHVSSNRSQDMPSKADREISISCEVEKAHIDWVMPYHLSGLYRKDKPFMGVDGNPTMALDEIAGAQMWIKGNLEVNAGDEEEGGISVPVELHSGWFGIPDYLCSISVDKSDNETIAHLLGKMLYGEVMTHTEETGPYHREKGSPVSAFEYRYYVKEVRLGFLKCNRKGTPVWLCMNTLRRPNYGIFPFVKKYENGKFERLPLKETGVEPQNELIRMFRNCIFAALRPDDIEAKVEWDTAKVAHQFIIYGYKKGYEFLMKQYAGKWPDGHIADLRDEVENLVGMNGNTRNPMYRCSA